MKKVFSLSLLTLLFLILLVWLGTFLMPKKPGLSFNATTYSALDGWRQDDHRHALKAFLKSCELILTRKASKPMPEDYIAGTNGDWHPACQAAVNLNPDKEPETRAFFEQYFTPLEVYFNGENEGVFTGYHEPLLHGSLTKTERYNVPLYKKPADIVEINLGDFREEYKGVSLQGTIKNNKLVPYADRAQIVDGALGAQDLELLWVDSEVDAFFLQVQGSGRVQLEDGRIIGVGYAGKNGQPYQSIGRIMVKEGIMTVTEASAQSLKKWLKDNPDRLRWLLDQNTSYVFFRLLGDVDGPYGSAEVTLTAERSLAVDRMHLPLHAPVWVDATRPDQDDKTVQDIPFQRLMIAQDTGGAIKGAVRGDVFWGFGAKADEIAGRMNNKGRLVLLLPHDLALKAAGR